MFIIKFCLNMFRASLCPSSGEQRPVTAFCVLFWFCWMWLVAVVGRCLVGCEHCEGFCSTVMPIFRRTKACYCIWCIVPVLLDVVGSGCGALSCRMWALIRFLFNNYAHLQENKGPVTAFGVLFWFCWMWLVAVVGRCLEGSEHSRTRTIHQMQ